MVAALSAGNVPEEYPLIVLAGPTGSGKSALAVHLALHLAVHLKARLAPHQEAEIVACDSVAVYRFLDIGSAKPSVADRARVPHHGLDLYDPGEFCTAGDYARHARAALHAIRGRGNLPIVAGGTGLYLRALLEGLAPSPPRDEGLRERLRERVARRGPGSLHRLLLRFDPQAAAAIHPNDAPKLIRSLEVTLTARQPQTAQWAAGRDPLRGYRILALGLDPPREALYARINARAEAMFRPAVPPGLLEETREVMERFGAECAALGSLGYAQARAVLRGEMELSEAIGAAQQGHRNYAKRQLTWFRSQLRNLPLSLPQPAQVRWIHGFGDEPAVQAEAVAGALTWLHGGSPALS